MSAKGHKQTRAPQQMTLRIVSPFNKDLSGLLQSPPISKLI
jgi:hypothetical protein